MTFLLALTGRTGRALRRLGWALLFSIVALASAQAASSSPPSSEAPKVVIDGEELPAVGFDRLSSFDYEIVDAGTGATPEEIEQIRKRDRIPAAVRAYHDKRVVLTGYLMPLLLENGLATKFVMMRDVTTCCYGNVPNMNDYVVVTMKGPGVKAVQDVPVELVGVFRVDEKYEDGYVTSLFEMTGEKFLGPKK